VDVETLKVNDMTLRQRIKKDRSANIECGGNRLGTKYWKDLVEEYKSTHDPLSLLKVHNPEEAVLEQLLSSLAALHSDNPMTRSIEPLVNYLQHTAALFEARRAKRSPMRDPCFLLTRVCQMGA
jgi:hypothetical protein